MFKKAGKVIFAEPCQTGNLLQSKVFRKVVADIVGDKQKFFHIFFLMVNITVSVLLMKSFVIPAMRRICCAASAPVRPEVLWTLLYFAKVPFTLADAARDNTIPITSKI